MKTLTRKLNRSYWWRNIIGVPIAFVLLISLFSASRYAYYRLIPRSTLFSYSSMVARQEKENVIVLTVRRNKTGQQFSFRDVLHCKIKDNYSYISYQDTAGFGREDGTVTYEWLYNSNKPNFSTTCYIQSLVTVHLPYGIDKTQIVTTPPFDWVKGT